MEDWKPDIFIYHSPCDDGFGAAWAVHQRWGDDVEYVPMNYGHMPGDWTGKNVLVGDFSFKRPVLDVIANQAASIIILDHHKTARDDLEPFDVGWAGDFPFCWRDVPATLRDLTFMDRPPVAAHFDMDKSGARLLWEFCHPGKEAPPLIDLVEDRDLWRFKLVHTKAFSLYLRAEPYDFATWSVINEDLARDAVGLFDQADAIKRFYDRQIAEMVNTATWREIFLESVPTVNCGGKFASDVGHALLQKFPEAPFAATYSDRHGYRGYSLRSEDGRMDVSEVAKRYGGGGHRNAAGFEVPAP